MRRAAAVLLAAALLTLPAAPASAHNELRSTDPADGATVARTPATVVLTFDEPALALGTQVLVTGPAGPAAVGAPQLVNATVRQPIVGGAPAGTYTVDWRVTSADGHPVTGHFTFTSRAAGAPGRDATPAPTPAPAPGTRGAAVLPWLVAAAVLLVAAVLVGVRVRRRVSGPAG